PTIRPYVVVVEVARSAATTPIGTIVGIRYRSRSDGCTTSEKTTNTTGKRSNQSTGATRPISADSAASQSRLTRRSSANPTTTSSGTTPNIWRRASATSALPIG